MRSALFFAVLAVFLISAQAWKHPSWKDIEENARKHIEDAKTHMAALKKHLPVNMQHMMDKVMKKLDQHHVKKDVRHSMETLQRDLMTRWRNLAATEGLHVRSYDALETLMKHMMLAQARHNMERSKVMETYSHSLATHFMGENRPASDIKALGGNLSDMLHNYSRKFMDGAETIMRRNGVNLNKENVQKVMHQAFVEAMKGKGMMEAVLAEMKKLGVNTAGLDAMVKKQLTDHFEKLKTEGISEVKKLLAAHKVSANNLLEVLKSKGKEMAEKMMAVHGAQSKTLMHRLEAMAKKAFEDMKPGSHHRNLMMKLHLIIRPAMNSHIQRIVAIFKKHHMGTSHTVIRYTIYHHFKDEVEDDHHHHHHHHWWHKKPVRLALMIGGSLFGVAVLISLIIVIVHALKERRRAPRSKTVIGEEKSTLPYSIMDDEKSATKA